MNQYTAPGLRTALTLAFALLLTVIGHGETIASLDQLSDRRPSVYIESGDDETINAAIRALPPKGGTIQLGPTLFPIRSPIVIDRDGVELRGINKETILRLTDAAECSVIVIGNLNTPVSHLVRNVQVSYLSIDGNRGAQKFECWGGPCDSGGLTFIRNNGITVRGAEDIVLKNLSTHNCRSGGIVLEKGCRRITISFLESYNNEFDGLAAYETEDSTFIQIHAFGNRSAGLSLDWDFNRNIIADSTFTRNGSQGIFMRDANLNQFRNLYLRDNGEQGLFVAETREVADSACTGNTFERLSATGNKTQGIRVNDASCVDNRIVDSRVAGNAGGNISLAAEGLLVGAESVVQQ